MAEGDGGGGGSQQQQQQQTPPDWRASIPEELRTEPMFKDIKDVGSLAKSYVAAQRMIGADKLVKPNDKWTQTDWDNFHNQIGRPATPDKYSFKVEGLPEGFKIDDSKLAGAKKALHDAGLTDKQASSVMKYYTEGILKDATDYQSSQRQSQETSMSSLTKEFGDQTSVKLDVAKSVVKKFGGETLTTLLEQSGMGNNPEFIKMFIKIGEAMLDDSAIGQGNNLILTDSTSAVKEIDKLKGDSDFQKSLGNRQDHGHRAALEKWTKLHEVAFPGTQQTQRK